MEGYPACKNAHPLIPKNTLFHYQWKNKIRGNEVTGLYLKITIIFSRTIQVSWYKNKHSPTHTYPDHQPSIISILHLLPSITSSRFNLCACQSFCTTSLWVLLGEPLGLEPSTAYSIHFLILSLSSFCNICPYHQNLFCCSTKIMLSNPSLSLISLISWLVGRLGFNDTFGTEKAILLEI